MNLFQMLDRVRDRVHRNRWTPERALAARGEDLAMRYLQRQKYIIVGRNWRPRTGRGEVDLIGWDGKTLVFVEVKTRSSDQTGAPERAVHPEKQRNLIRAADAFLRAAKLNREVARFDVITVIAEGVPQLALYRDAFSFTAAGAWRNNPSGPALSDSYR